MEQATWQHTFSSPPVRMPSCHPSSTSTLPLGGNSSLRCISFSTSNICSTSVWPPWLSNKAGHQGLFPLPFGCSRLIIWFLSMLFKNDSIWNCLILSADCAFHQTDMFWGIISSNIISLLQYLFSPLRLWWQGHYDSWCIQFWG